MTDIVQHRLPILKTISRAFGFVIGDAGPIIRLSWFPMLLAALVQGWAANFQLTRQLEGLAQNKNLMSLFTGQEMGLIVLANLAASFAVAVAMVALLRIVLYGDRRPSTYVHFAIGKTEFLAFLFPVLLALVFVFAVIIVAIASLGAEGARNILGSITAMSMSRETLGPMAIGFLAMFLLMFWVMVRISLWYPSIVAKKRIDLDDIIGVTKWKFWPLLFTYILFGLAIAVIFAVLAFVVLKAIAIDLGQGSGLAMLLEPDKQGRLGVMTSEMLKYQQEHLLAIQAVGYVMNIFGTALFAGLIGFAYRAIKGIEPEQHLQE